jgi:DNA-binding transcriptional ArsR family regulator
MIESAQDMLETLEVEIQEKVKVFALLGNEVRLKIVTLLLNVERLCVCDISDILKVNQSPISQHLRKLKDAGLLENAREGITIYYKIPQEVRLMLRQIVQGDKDDR